MEAKQTELESLNNFAHRLNLEVKEYIQDDKRKTVKTFYANRGSQSISPKLDYEQMNHFLLGYSRCIEAINKVIN
jgi:hypothetical protein